MGLPPRWAILLKIKAMKKPENKRVSLVVLDKTAKVRASKILRLFTKKTYRDLIKAVDNSQSIFLAELVPEQFYRGVKEVVVLLDELELNQIPYNILINGELETKEALLNIKNKVENITLEDFR